MRPCCIATRYGRSRDSQIARTVPCVAAVGFAAMRFAIACARSQSSARGTTSVTIPIRNAESAPTRSSFPARAMRSVSPRPIRRMSPTGSSADTRPADTCESKKVASDEQITTSDSFRK